MTSDSLSPAHVDPKALEALRDVMEDQYPILLDSFLEDSRARLAQLQAARDAGDLRAVSLAAHSLKGSSSNLGAVALAALCSALERCALQPPAEDVAVLIEAITVEFALVTPLYEEERDRFTA